jgi:hypothetical protein
MALVAALFFVISSPQVAKALSAFEDIDGDQVFTEAVDNEVSLVPDDSGNVDINVTSNLVILKRSKVMVEDGNFINLYADGDISIGKRVRLTGGEISIYSGGALVIGDRFKAMGVEIIVSGEHGVTVGRGCKLDAKDQVLVDADSDAWYPVTFGKGAKLYAVEGDILIGGCDPLVMDNAKLRAKHEILIQSESSISMTDSVFQIVFKGGLVGYREVSISGESLVDLSNSTFKADRAPYYPYEVYLCGDPINITGVKFKGDPDLEIYE